MSEPIKKSEGVKIKDDIRCKNCSKLLAKRNPSTGIIEIKCVRCSAVNEIVLSRSDNP